MIEGWRILIHNKIFPSFNWLQDEILVTTRSNRILHPITTFSVWYPIPIEQPNRRRNAAMQNDEKDCINHFCIFLHKSLRFPFSKQITISFQSGTTFTRINSNKWKKTWHQQDFEWMHSLDLFYWTFWMWNVRWSGDFLIHLWFFFIYFSRDLVVIAFQMQLNNYFYMCVIFYMNVFLFVGKLKSLVLQKM